MSVSIGDRVRFVNSHEAHHPALKSHVGEEGEVIGGPDSRGRVQVRFDRTDLNQGQWWIHPAYLRTPRS